MAQSESKSGYPGQAAFVDNSSRGGFGSTIPIADMPARFVKLWMAIRKLERDDQFILACKFAWDRDKMGKPVTDKQRAEMAGMSVHSFKHNLRRIKRNIMKQPHTKLT